MNNAAFFKEQLTEHEQKAEQRYLALQKEKNEEKLKTEKLILTLNTQQKEQEAKFYEQQANVAKQEAVSLTLRQQLEKTNTQIQGLFDENQQLKTDLHLKDQQRAILQSETQLLKKEFSQCQKSIAVLEEKNSTLKEKRGLKGLSRKKR